ncbi:gene transfer agent family protein [Agrobacterium tumefaciens]|uniref:gene transfer agent family protein n=1 Tax=Agrobacterium tumefaciens TaxID=358 RepID=UPI0034579F8F
MSELPLHRQFFGDQERSFHLAPDLVLELERKVGAGIGGLSRRFFAGDFRFIELTEVIRLGLIGGGTEPSDAAQLVTTYSARMSITALYAVALPVVEALMFGRVQSIAQYSPRKTRKKAHA